MTGEIKGQPVECAPGSAHHPVDVTEQALDDLACVRADLAAVDAMREAAPWH